MKFYSVVRKRISCGPHGRMVFQVNFTDDVKLRGLPSWLLNVPSHSVPLKKSNLVFNRARMKATSQSFCSILKSSPVQDLASLMSVQYSGFFMEPARATLPWREQVSAPWEGRSSGKKDREFLCSTSVMLIWDWKKTEAFQIGQWSSQVFMHFW